MALLAACAGTAPIAEGTAVEAEPAAAAPVAVAEAPPPPVPERPIPEDSVYPLLTAEFALRRRDYDTALSIYLQQAALLRDPAISAHTTHLAQFLQREREALEAVSLWVELEPDNVEANSTLATLLVRRGETLRALPHLAAVARTDGDAKFPILLNQFDKLAAKDQAALANAVDALVPEFPTSIPLLITRALMAEEIGNRTLALEQLGDVFAVEPYQHQALLLEAKVLLESQARKPYARIEAALRDDPQRDELRLQYARMLARQDMDAAREQFEILSANNPRDGDLLFSLALLNEELEDTLAAKAYLRELLKLEQRPDEAYFVLGRIAEAEGDMAAAIDHYMQVGDGKDFLPATLRIGNILLARGDDARFAAYFASLRQSYPPRGEQLYSLQANLLNEAQRNNASRALLDEAILAYPRSTSLRYSRSVVHERAGDIAAAEADLRSILAREPNNATALNALGYTLANRTERYAEAQALIARALALQPNEPAILDSMGWVLYRRGDYEQALQYLTRAYASFPDPEVAAHLGEVMWVSGNTQGARNIWRGALTADSTHEVLLQTLERLGVTDLP